MVFAPEVVEELCSTHVLTTKWIDDGERLSLSNEEDVPRLCSVALNAYLAGYVIRYRDTPLCDPLIRGIYYYARLRENYVFWIGGMVIQVPTDLQN